MEKLRYKDLGLKPQDFVAIETIVSKILYMETVILLLIKKPTRLTNNQGQRKLPLS